MAKGDQGEVFLTLGDEAGAEAPGTDAEQMIALDAALAERGRCDERRAKAVELRFLGGLTEEQIAAAAARETLTRISPSSDSPPGRNSIP